ncbi:MAG: cytochrome C biogenesis protein [Gemmatimonadetes bacterium]|nr:cytochrome C biogenesis protein [Gemmatimonadota bacterium]
MRESPRRVPSSSVSIRIPSPSGRMHTAWPAGASVARQQPYHGSQGPDWTGMPPVAAGASSAASAIAAETYIPASGRDSVLVQVTLLVRPGQCSSVPARNSAGHGARSRRERRGPWVDTGRGASIIPGSATVSALPPEVVIPLVRSPLRRLLPALLAGLAGAARALPAQEHPVTFMLGPERTQVRPGGTVALTLRAAIPPGWHLYSITQEPGGPIPTTIAVGPETAFALAGGIDGTVPRAALDPNFGMVTETHEDSAAFRLPVRALAASGRHAVEVRVQYQVCNNRYCLPPVEDTLRAVVAVAGVPVVPPTAPVPGASAAQATSTPQPAATAPAAAPPARSGAAEAVAPRAAGGLPPLGPNRSARGLIAFLWLAAVMGALSLLTPCVFPMVPITISYFSRAERGSRGQAVGDALLYAGGIVGAFTALGLGFALLAGVAGMNRFAAHPALNLAIAALFGAFALSLFGLLEIALPPRLLNWLYRASGGSRYGRVGTTLLMGVTFAVTTFTCTAPFVGTLLVSAASGDWRWPAAGLLVFATVFSLPFLFLALVPRAVARLPKSGEWLATVKATLGFIELAAALKFISNADLVLGGGVFTRDVVRVAWTALFLALALYLGGVRLRRPQAERSRRVRYPLGGLAAAAVAVWLGTGVGGRRLGELDSFLPPAPTGSGEQSAGELDWLVDDYEGALAGARGSGRPVLIDFTGYTCTNCRWMEANMFPRPDVARELERFVRVRLFTDGQSERNRQQQAFEQERFGTVALPLYAVVDSAGATRATFLGMTRDAAEFIAFLSGARAAAE